MATWINVSAAGRRLGSTRVCSTSAAPTAGNCRPGLPLAPSLVSLLMSLPPPTIACQNGQEGGNSPVDGGESESGKRPILRSNFTIAPVAQQDRATDF